MISSFFRRKHIPFLFSELGRQNAADCFFHVVPVPLERSVSYGGGTAKGPDAILDASQQLELFDGYSVPAEKGIYTWDPVNCDNDVHNVLKAVSDRTRLVVQQGKLPVVLGGEHTVTVGSVKGIKEFGIDFAVVQFDAHADLRNSYEGSGLSHACTMRRIHEMEIPFVQIGVRSISANEVMFRKEHNIVHYDACSLYKSGAPGKILPRNFPRKVYITFDVDGLDCALVPATGTPEPGGLGWWQTMDILQRISREAEIIGFDIVELAPRKYDHSSDFTIARLAYNLMGYAARQS